jgi:hypothetical protein
MFAQERARATFLQGGAGNRRSPLTPASGSGCITAVKPPLLFCLILACASCTTLENRRDLYRSPAEGYEQWHPNPPPTRGTATGPVRRTTTTTTTTTIERHGVTSFPEETLP